MRFALILMLAACSLSYARPPTKVDFSEDVKRFKVEKKEGKGHVHRSGQYKKDQSLFDVTGFEHFPVGYEEDSIPSNAEEAGVYKVVIDDAVAGIGDIVKKDKSNSDLTIRKLAGNGDVIVLSVTDDRHVLPKSTLEVDSLVEIAKQLAKSRLKAFRNKIEYESRDITYANGKLFEIEVRFRRLFKGMVVRKSLSFVYIKLGADGDVRSIEIKWPKFVRLKNSNRPNVDIAFGKAEKYFENAPIIRSSERTDTPLKVTVKGVASSWVPSQDGLSIQQGYSFLGEVEYDNGEPAPFIFDYMETPN